MKTSSLIKAIQKKNLNIKQFGNEFTIKGQSKYGQFFNQNGFVICASTCRNGQESDSMTDYFPQSFHYTIKSFMASLTEAK